MELCVAGGLLYLGYYISNQNKDENEKISEVKQTKEDFQSNEYLNIETNEKLAKKAVRKQLKENPKPAIYQPELETLKDTGDAVISKLSGVEISKENFMSDNKGKEFEPNFGANVTQSTANLDVPNRRLESSGISQFSCKKQEIGQFFAPTSKFNICKWNTCSRRSYERKIL